MREQPLVLTAQEPLGPNHRTNQKEALLTLLQHIHTRPLAIQSNRAREMDHTVAEASSRGYITTQIIPGSLQYGRIWKITGAGLMFLNMGASLIAKDELAAYNAHG